MMNTGGGRVFYIGYLMPFHAPVAATQMSPAPTTALTAGATPERVVKPTPTPTSTKTTFPYHATHNQASASASASFGTGVRFPDDPPRRWPSPGQYDPKLPQSAAFRCLACVVQR
jgi:hypothetical protein